MDMEYPKLGLDMIWIIAWVIYNNITIYIYIFDYIYITCNMYVMFFVVLFVQNA